MGGSGFILAINLAVAGLIGAAFASIAIYDRARSAARWLAAAYLMGMGFFVIEMAIHYFQGGRLAVTAAAAMLLFGLAAFNVGLSRKYDNAFPSWLHAVVALAGVMLVYAVYDLERHSLARMLGYQLGYFVMQALGALIVFRTPRLRTQDMLLAGVLSLSALQFLIKPFIAHAVGGWGADPAAYLDSYYALISQSIGTVSGLAVALMAIIILFRDVLADAHAKSETDTLSGLHNRRGFEARAAHALRRAVRDERPVSLVIADLDHFKSVNDTFGHGSGDRVIRAFATFLGAAAGPTSISGRIGGEEFAVLLPGTDQPSGRLFAEGARSAFGAMLVPGLPGHLRFTASFGVAELERGETLDDLMRRADEALYAAKRDGRDCVRTSRAGGADKPATRLRLVGD